MQKILSFFLILLLSFQIAKAQEIPNGTDTKLIQIINSDDLIYEIINGQEIQRLIGNVAILHDGTYFYCDSARHDIGANAFKAYNNVKVEMPNQVTLTCNRLNYDGITRVAEAIGKANATDGKATLTSDKLIYHRNEGYGFYNTGGKLVSDDNTLTSKLGYYYPDKKMAYFKKDVKLVSPDYTLKTDTLGYNTETKTALFMTYTLVENKEGTFATTKGEYNTEKKTLKSDSRTVMVNTDYKMEADNTTYDNETHIAVMTGNVFMQQKDTSATMYGDSATYNRETGQGAIHGHLVMIQKDSSSILTAQWADFNKESGTGIAHDNVIIRQKDTSYTIYSDAAYFNNKQKEGKAYGHLFMFQKDSSYMIVADTAYFYNEAKKGKAVGHVIIRQKDSTYTVFADTTTFAQGSNQGTASGKVKITQKDSSLTIYGGHALFFRDTKETFITKNPVSLQRFDKDSLYISADTLYAKEDTLKRRTFKAYHNVAIYMRKMQSRADSMIYYYSDSLIVLYKKPILWADSSQLTGDLIKMWMKKSKLDSLWVSGNSFLASQEDTVGFNQIKGKEFRAKFADNQLQKMHIIGNSESIYYIKDEKKVYQGMNQSTSQEMIIHMKDNKATKIVFIAKPEATYKPMHEVLFQDIKLEGMEWRVKEKPTKPIIVESEPES